MKRRLLAMALSLAMVFTMLPATSLQAAAGDLELADTPVAEGNLARSATASAPRENTPVKNVNDGKLATGVASTSWNSWNAAESAYPMPVTLTWGQPQTVASMRVMWWSDGGGVVWPSNAKVQYQDNGQWKDITDAGTEHGGYNGASGVWNIVNFENPVTTTAIRMLVGRNVQGTSGIGISEWEVYGKKIKEQIKSAAINGSSKLLTGDRQTYDGRTIPETLAKNASYEWSVAPADVAAIEGDANKSSVTLKGLKEGQATLKLKATYEGESKETEFAIRVRSEEVKSIDLYKTSTAAGVAPILPDSVVANGLEFDDPTPSLKSQTKPTFDFAEEFNSRLIPVTWETVDPAKYAKSQVGKSFTVKGTAVYGYKEYVATAVVTVKDAVVSAESNSSVTFENVQLNDVFWAPKQEVNAKASLKKAIEEIEKASGGEPNYDNAIKKLNGEKDYDAFNGYVFQDSDIYKSIEAISYTLSATQNETDEEMVATRKFLEDKIESWIQKIEKVQYADGYIDTFFTLRSQSSSGGGSAGTHRWLSLWNHEMYNAGHFLEGVVAYTRYREGIGKPDYRLYVAGKRFADHIVATFGPAGTRHEVPGHEEIELALVKFGKLAEEYEGKGAGQDYYDTVKVLIDRRGESASLRESGYKGDEYSQDRTPFKDETSAVGHSVRAGYFYTGVTDIATMLPNGNTDRDDYLNSLDTIWESVTAKKTYITGAVGAATATSSSEGFGADYDLPPAQSYAEICAAIAVANWNQRMNLLHEDGKYADMIETNLYNSILVGTNLDGNRFYYSTLLQASNGNARSPWFGCACCPPNLMRTIAAASGYMYTVHKDDVFVNMYAGSDGKVNVGGTQVGLKQETQYPWDGNVVMTVNPDAAKAFTMNIRVPGWVNQQKNKTVTIKVNNQAVTATPEKGYIAINRTWNKNDKVEISIPMEIRLTEADPNIVATQGRIAIQRGPIVYCMEKAGNAQLNPEISDFNPLNFVIPRDAQLTATYNEDLLNGVVEITGNVKYQDGSNQVDAKLQAIPYYAWNNRGDDAEFVAGQENPKNNSSKMLIWTNAANASSSGGTDVSPDDAEPEIPVIPIPQLRGYATPSVNFVGWNEGADHFADDELGTIWNGHSDPNLNNRPQWMMYNFGDKKATINGSTIRFKDDGGVVTPSAIKIEYLQSGTVENGEWAEVTKIGTWTCENAGSLDASKEGSYEFEPVTTSAIRVTMEHAVRNGTKMPVAVFDWKVIGDIKAADAQKTELSGKVSEIDAAVKKLNQSDYTTESWDALQTALTAAKAAVENANIGIIALTEAEKALLVANAKLDKKADAAVVATLQNMVTKYETDKELYSTASWTEFEKTLAEAKEVLEANSGKAAINAARKKLAAAAESLDKKATAAQVNDLKAELAKYTESEYTAASWAKVRAAYTQASTVANSTEPGEAAVAAAKSALENVISKLDKKAGAAAVNGLATEVAKYVESEYTADSWKRFAYTLAEVKAVAESTDPGANQVAAAKISLDTAKDKLEKKASSSAVTALTTSVESVLASVNQTEYTKESWADFTRVLNDIKQSAANASQSQIEALNASLDNAKDALKKKATAAEVEAFKNSLATYKAYKESDYLPAGYAALASVLKRADEVAEDASASTIEATNKLLTDAAKKLVTVASYNNLKAAVEREGTYDKNQYTAEVWDAYATAIKNAQKVLNAKDITQAEVNAATEALATAESKLQKNGGSTEDVNKTALNASIAAAKAKVQAAYTSASWTKMQTALRAAEAVAANSTATQAQVDKAKADLDNAVRELVAYTTTKKKATIGLKESFSVKSNGSTYTTSKSSVVKITNAKTGQVKGMKTGKAVVKATNNTTGKITEYTITVKKAPKKISKVTFNKKAIKNKKATLKKGKSATLKVTLPKGTASYKITYTSSKKKIATVDAKGKIKAKKKGKTTITVKTFNKKKMTFTLTVK